MDIKTLNILEGLADHEIRLEALENAQPYKKELSPDDLQMIDYDMIESHTKKAVAKELQQFLLRLESLEQAVYKQKKKEKPKWD